MPLIALLNNGSNNDSNNLSNGIKWLKVALYYKNSKKQRLKISDIKTVKKTILVTNGTLLLSYVNGFIKH